MRHRRVVLTASSAAVLSLSVAACSGAPTEGPSTDTASTAAAAMRQPFTPPTAQFATTTTWKLSAAAARHPELAGQQWLAGSHPVQLGDRIYLLTTDATLTGQPRDATPIKVRVLAVGPAAANPLDTPVTVSDPISLLPTPDSVEGTAGTRVAGTIYQAGNPDLTVTNPDSPTRHVVLVGYTGDTANKPTAITARGITLDGDKITVEDPTSATSTTDRPWRWNPTGGDLIVTRDSTHYDGDLLGVEAQRLYPAPVTTTTDGQPLTLTQGGGTHRITAPRPTTPKTAYGIITVAPTITVDDRQVTMPALQCGATFSSCKGASLAVQALSSTGAVVASQVTVGEGISPQARLASITWDGHVTDLGTMKTQPGKTFPRGLATMDAAGTALAVDEGFVFDLGKLTMTRVGQDTALVTTQDAWQPDMGARAWIRSPWPTGTPESLPRDTNAPIAVTRDGTGVFLTDPSQDTRLRYDGYAGGDIVLVPPAS